MKTEDITLRSLKAEDGMVLTNGETFSTLVYLGVHDSPENWHEVTEEEAERLKAEIEANKDQPVS